jgi:hypothetical protein
VESTFADERRGKLFAELRRLLSFGIADPFKVRSICRQDARLHPGNVEALWAHSRTPRSCNAASATL